MMTYIEYYQDLLDKLSIQYDELEAKSIANIFFEDSLQITKTELIIHKDKTLSVEQSKNYEKGLAELISGQPIQYVVGFTYFEGLKISVDRNVLIPRPETEELVGLIKKSDDLHPSKIIDFCSGSGCISLSLKNHFKESHVLGYDVSIEAIRIAQKNAELNSLEVDYQYFDVLNYADYIQNIPKGIDIIVSNPPYVLPSEKESIHKNVLLYEPHLALFIEEEIPFIFYHKIMEIGMQKLSKNGRIYFECNHLNALALQSELKSYDYKTVTLHKDFRDLDRFIIIQ